MSYDLGAPSPSAQHASIDAAIEASDPDGTRSILDIGGIGEGSDFCDASPLDDQALEDLFGTTTPTHEMIEQNMDLFDNLERGCAVYLTAYIDGRPDELFFAGYSFD